MPDGPTTDAHTWNAAFYENTATSLQKYRHTENCAALMSVLGPQLMEPSNPVHKTPTCIVYENCLLELFEVCPVCRRGTDVIYKKGECTEKPVKADAIFRDSHRLYLKAKQCENNYMDNLLDLIFHEVFQDPAPYVNEVLKISKPEDLSA
ncbi:unnamed protein product [Pleuronectes platessa]|uniref:Uncharacterized protein n=1 Tax=Pleuronectes platessa TaxID=8262 RepID=A0A9N7VNA3_PLEPL|nr:unnamed protein product [Pleuronectes platessa]